VADAHRVRLLSIAASSGLVLTLPIPAPWIIALGWIYGTAGLVGFLAQIVVGIQGRLLPLFGWYRMMERGDMQPPTRSARTLASSGVAKSMLVAWVAGIPLLILRLASGINPVIAAGASSLLIGVSLGAAQGIVIVTGQNSAT
jgi:hypothetical protein